MKRAGKMSVRQVVEVGVALRVKDAVLCNGVFPALRNDLV